MSYYELLSRITYVVHILTKSAYMRYFQECTLWRYHHTSRTFLYQVKFYKFEETHSGVPFLVSEPSRVKENIEFVEMSVDSVVILKLARIWFTYRNNGS